MTLSMSKPPKEVKWSVNMQGTSCLTERKSMGCRDSQMAVCRSFFVIQCGNPLGGKESVKENGGLLTSRDSSSNHDWASSIAEVVECSLTFALGTVTVDGCCRETLIDEEIG